MLTFVDSELTAGQSNKVFVPELAGRKADCTTTWSQNILSSPEFQLRTAPLLY